MVVQLLPAVAEEAVQDATRVGVVVVVVQVMLALGVQVCTGVDSRVEASYAVVCEVLLRTCVWVWLSCVVL